MDFWVIKMYQCRFNSCNKFTTLGGNVDSAGGCVGGSRNIWKLFVLSTQFCCALNTALKKEILMKLP